MAGGPKLAGPPPARMVRDLSLSNKARNVAVVKYLRSQRRASSHVFDVRSGVATFCGGELAA
jgi:hypothetical protein